MMAGVKIQTITALVLLSHVAAFLIFLPNEGATGPVKEDCNPNATYFSCLDRLHLSNHTEQCPRYRPVVSCLESICKCDVTHGVRMSLVMYRKQISHCPALPDGQCLRTEIENCFGDFPIRGHYLNKTQCLHLNTVYPDMKLCFKNVTDLCNSTYADTLAKNAMILFNTRQTTCLYVDFMEEWKNLGNQGE